MSCTRHWWSENIHLIDLADLRDKARYDLYSIARDLKGYNKICVSCLKEEVLYRKRSKEIIMELTKEGG